MKQAVGDRAAMLLWWMSHRLLGAGDWVYDKSHGR